MAIVERNRGSGVILQFNDVTNRLVDVKVEGSRGRVVEIIIDEALRVRRHVREIAKNVADDVWALTRANIAYAEDDVAPILPTIQVIWHDPDKR